MNVNKAILAVVSFLLSFVTLATAGELKIDLKIEGQASIEIRLQIEGDTATASVAEEMEKFNLKEMSWFEPTTNKWMTLAQCKEWAEQSKVKSVKSVEAAPANIRPFLLWSLDPKFKVEKANDTLRLTSGHVDYVIEGQASKTDVGKYFRYAVLNSYKKAMTERKLPPFSELKAINEMEKLGHIPKKMTVTIPGIPNAPTFELKIEEVKQR